MFSIIMPAFPIDTMNARLQRFLTDVHYMHKLMATIPVYPAQFTKTGSERRVIINNTATLYERARNGQGETPVFHNITLSLW